MQQAGNVNVIVGMAAMVAALAAAAPQASAADLLKLATAQRGAWESAPPELGQSAGIFAKHGIDLDVVYTRDGEVESSVTSGGSDVGVGVGTIGVLRAYAKGAPVRVIGASTTGTANYWYVQANSPIKTVKDINGKTIAYWTSNPSSRYDVFDFIKQFGLKARPTAIGGAAATLNQVMSGHVDVGWAEAPFGVEAIEQGKIRVVARASDVRAIRRDTVRVVITNVDARMFLHASCRPIARPSTGCIPALTRSNVTPSSLAYRKLSLSGCAMNSSRRTCCRRTGSSVSMRS